jgi:L-Ala-D/L-Glu epimerase
MMKVSFSAIPNYLRFRYPFRIAHGERSVTDVVFVRAECEGRVGFGEATLPPYLGISTEDVVAFLKIPELTQIQWPFSPDQLADQLDAIYPGNMPAKAAINMALWSLYAQLAGKTWTELFQIANDLVPPHTYTLGISNEYEMKEKLDFAKAQGFNLFKLKLDGSSDLNMLEMFRRNCSDDFAVDVNQGWKDANYAIRTSRLLSEAGCILIEQPFHRGDAELTKILRAEIEIPVIADEACQTLADMPFVHSVYDGINIKLQKCGGLSAARKMIAEAKRLNMKMLIGCMSESSVGCDAAEVLAPLCQWADLDGPWLIENDEELMLKIGYKKSLSQGCF